MSFLTTKNNKTVLVYTPPIRQAYRTAGYRLRWDIQQYGAVGTTIIAEQYDQDFDEICMTILDVGEEFIFKKEDIDRFLAEYPNCRYRDNVSHNGKERITIPLTLKHNA